MDLDTFFTDAKARLNKTLEPLTVEVLAMMLKKNVRFLDTHYIHNRTQEIIEKTIGKLKFNNEQILMARRAFLDVLLDGAQKQLFGFEDDRREAKKNLKSRKKKQEAKEVLDKLDRLENGKPADLTEQRDMECEPICQAIAKKILSREYALKDEDFIKGSIESDDEMLIGTITRFIFDELMDQVVLSLDNSYKLANEVNWGCRRDQIRMEQIDNRLKK